MVSTLRRTALFISLVAALSVSACTSDSSDDDSSGTDSVSVNEEAAALVPDDIRDNGTITVGHAESNAPMEFIDPDGETLIGFDIDLADAIAATLDLEAEHTGSTFDALIPGLSAQRYDMALSGFFITPERERQVDFVPYLTDGSALVVRGGNPLGLSMDPAELCGVRVAGERGAVQLQDFIPDISADCVADGKPPVQVQEFPTLDEAHLALSSGRADAIMEDSVPSGYRAERSNGQFEVAPGDVYEPVTAGIAFPKDSELADAVKAAVASLEADGTLKELMNKWSIPETALLPSYE